MLFLIISNLYIFILTQTQFISEAPAILWIFISYFILLLTYLFTMELGELLLLLYDIFIKNPSFLKGSIAWTLFLIFNFYNTGKAMFIFFATAAYILDFNLTIY